MAGLETLGAKFDIAYAEPSLTWLCTCSGAGYH
jgi:hypothetical protein